MLRLIPVCIVIAATLVGCAPQRDVPRLEDGWTYERIRGELSMRVALPREAYTHLVFRAYIAEFTADVDGRRIYAFRDASRHQRLSLHVVPLPRDAAGKMLTVHVPRAPDTTIFGAAPYLATEETLPHAIELVAREPLRDDASDIVLAFVLMIAGAISLGASIVRRRGDVMPMRWFGIFTLLYGTRLVMQSYLLPFLGASLATAAYIEAFITYVIPIPGWALASRLIGRGWRSTLHWQVVVFAIFAPIGIASDIVTRDPLSLDAVNNVLVILGGVNVLANLLALRERRTPELRIVLAGALVFLAFALHNNLANLGVLPWRDADETLGFVIFVAALGYAATRSFMRGERERIAIENELATAREIQQSILPTSMPEIVGLRFEARFVPASSVAGDLYDVIRIDDAHAGVLVADVAGHGVPAALIASMVKIAVSSNASLASDPAALLGAVNAALAREVRRAFVTATFLYLNADRVTVCNAGHPPPLLLRDGAFTELGPHGVLLGRFAAVRYTSATFELREGDRIVAYTDGIIEARNARGEQFGEERLRDLLREGASCQRIVEAVERWRGAGDDVDDLTIVSVVSC